MMQGTWLESCVLTGTHPAHARALDNSLHAHIQSVIMQAELLRDLKFRILARSIGIRSNHGKLG